MSNSNLLTQHECIPTSMTIRQRSERWNSRRIAGLVIAILRVFLNAPFCSSTQYSSCLSPRSIRMFIGIGFGTAPRRELWDLVLFFFIAGLLLHFERALSRS